MKIKQKIFMLSWQYHGKIFIENKLESYGNLAHQLIIDNYEFLIRFVSFHYFNVSYFFFFSFRALEPLHCFWIWPIAIVSASQKSWVQYIIYYFMVLCFSLLFIAPNYNAICKYFGISDLQSIDSLIKLTN